MLLNEFKVHLFPVISLPSQPIQCPSYHIHGCKLCNFHIILLLTIYHKSRIHFQKHRSARRPVQKPVHHPQINEVSLKVYLPTCEKPSGAHFSKQSSTSKWWLMLFVDLVVPTLAGAAAGLAIFLSMLLHCFSSLICHLLHLTGNSPTQWGNYSFVKTYA